MLAPLCGPPSQLECSRELPARALFAACGRVDAPGVLELVRDLARSGMFSLSVGGLRRSIDEVSRAARVPLEDALDGLSGEVSFGYWSAGRIGWFPMMALAAGARQMRGPAEAMRGAHVVCARALAGDAVRVSLASSNSGEQIPPRAEICFVQYPHFRVPALRAPAFGLGDGRLWIGSDPRAVAELLRPRARRLADASGFRRLVRHLPSRRSCLVYVDVPAIVDRAFEPYARRVLKGLLPASGDAIRRTKMPPGQAIADHLEVAGLSLVPVAGGIRIDARTPMGAPLTVAAGVGIVVGALRGR
jgi:hypothetical protein